MPAVDAGSYLRRIGLAHPGAPSAAALADLHRAHLMTVPFENLDIHLGIPIVLDEERFLDKIVRRRRGGFCYELNGAFAWLLGRLGFGVTLLSANAWSDGAWGIEHDHLALRVDLAEPWLADVGFGDSFVEPLRLVAGLEQPQATGTYRLAREGAHWILERRQSPASAFERLYRFTLAPRVLSEFAPACAYHQGPDSHFTRGPVCSLASPDGRVTLRSDRLISTRGGEKAERPIPDETAWRAALRERFGIEL